MNKPKKESGVYKKLGDTLWVHYQGQTYTVSLKAEIDPLSRPPTASGVSASGLLKSPMPGKILKVNVKTGDHVKSGQTVCVIEAMKMEYALKAPFDGKIKGVYKNPGDLVSLDEKVADVAR